MEIVMKRVQSTFFRLLSSFTSLSWSANCTSELSSRHREMNWHKLQSCRKINQIGSLIIISRQSSLWSLPICIMTIRSAQCKFWFEHFLIKQKHNLKVTSFFTKRHCLTVTKTIILPVNKGPLGQSTVDYRHIYKVTLVIVFLYKRSRF